MPTIKKFRVLFYFVLLSLCGYSSAILGASATLKEVNFSGANETVTCNGCYPPDTHGAVGALHYVQIVNGRIRVYGKTPIVGTTESELVRDESLADFFGYWDQTLFDPRVVYDPDGRRWIATAEAMPESMTAQRQFIAVSWDDDPTGPFFVYDINVNFFNNSFWDFPQLGFNQNAVILTGNVYSDARFFMYSAIISINKQDLYNGTLSYRLFDGLNDPTLAPPIVVDNNINAYLISARPSGNALKLYTLEDAGIIDVLSGPVDISVNGYVPPAPARQPDTGATLDAGDSRFINASVQKGIGLWQIHTIGNGGYITPKFYLIDLAQKNVAWTHLYFASQTSNDFNASIAGGPGGYIFVSWTSNDPVSNIQAQARFAGTDTLGPAVFFGTSAYTSSIFYSPTGGVERWGDYSSVTIDPVEANRAWVTNEITESQTTWGSRIFNIGVP